MLEKEQLGLSPQVRGTERPDLAHGLPQRFIPAGAGNRFRSAHRWDRITVYPRRCGEQAELAVDLLEFAGLSPQVRGTDVAHVRALVGPRFIPAGAGNRALENLMAIICAVYPRRCGEQSPCSAPRPWGCGLSPQVRGTGAVKNRHVAGTRFIPAGAGNSIPRRCARRWRSVYPRRCGEQDECHHSPSSDFGLSPQVRGTGDTGQRRPIGGRFIPAGAGNRLYCHLIHGCSAVYPRRCGEQLL